MAIEVAAGSTSAGVGRFGSYSFRSSSFFTDGSIYSHTLLVSAMSYIIKNHCIQSEGWLRMRLTFNSFVVIILKFKRVQLGEEGST